MWRQNTLKSLKGDLSRARKIAQYVGKFKASAGE